MSLVQPGRAGRVSVELVSLADVEGCSSRRRWTVRRITATHNEQERL